ncbi:hypothetical protein [Variovorax sp. 770b2]|uniref:hypothetical protein n=1 Tax=Variovorax sp. 770b2 TaxID=1566271 RepID=UPI000B878F6A|nr:hypothetical protein [Variovorax sp. 770b2]
MNWGIQLCVHLRLNLLQRIRGILPVPAMQGVRDVSRGIGRMVPQAFTSSIDVDSAYTPTLIEQ